MAERQWLKKLKQFVFVSFVVKMVFLSEIREQWPWSPNAVKDYSDKEIYTHIVTPSITNQEWVIPVTAPMPGYAYVGIRLSVAGKHDTYSTSPRFVRENHSPVFGHPWDIYTCTNTSWTRLSFPILHRMFDQTIQILIAHDTPCFGKVELLAQKFDDLLEDDSHITYVYYDDTSRETPMIDTSRNNNTNESVSPMKILYSL